MGFLGIAIMAILATSVSASSYTCECGLNNKGVQSRIVNGEYAGIHQFPFIVALRDAAAKHQFCGGSLINSYYVLTAAHCTVQYVVNRRTIEVVIGEHDTSKTTETTATKHILVQRIIQHKEFIPQYVKNDISLLLLSQKVETNKYVSPICLSPVPLNIAYQNVKIIGWGLTRYQGQPSPVLQHVDVQVLHRNVCRAKYTSFQYNPVSQMCTFASQKSACNGDSGGPVVYLDNKTGRYVQAGLVSYGIICGDDNPNVHTDVSSYFSWIQENIRATFPQPTCNKVD